LSTLSSNCPFHAPVGSYRANAFGLLSEGVGSSVTADTTGVITSGAIAHAGVIRDGGSLTVTNSSLTANGPGASALFATTPLAGGAPAGASAATLTNVTLTSPQGVSIAADGGINNIVLSNSQALVNNGLWLSVTSTDALNPTVVNITVDPTVIQGAAITAPGSTSNVSLIGGSLWTMTGTSNVTTLTNDASTINFTAPAGDPTQLASYKTLTAVNYIGAGGTIGLNTRLAGDGAPSDRLVINGGTATGNSLLRISNAAGGGALTTGNGILVVDTINGGTTVPGIFALSGRVAAGPYDYTLFRSSVDASNAQAWYLRSTIDCTLDPANPACAAPEPGPGSGPNPRPPNFRPETSLYAAIPSMALLYGRTLLDTLHERVGDEEDLRNRQRANGAASGAWGRVIGQHGNHDGDPLGVLGSGPKFNYDIGAFQGGQDLLRRDGADGSRDHAGLYAAVGLLNGGVTHVDRTFAGTDSLNAYSLGGYWTHFGAPGWYLDAILQGTWYDSKGVSGRLPTLTTNGWGFAGSLEAGYPIKLGGGFIVEPQAQIVYQNVSLGDGTDTAATVQFRNIESFAARIGARFARTWSLDDSRQPRLITAWIRPSVWNEFRGAPQTLFSSADGPVPFQSNISGTWFELNAGMDAKITSATSLFSNVGYQVSTNGRATAYNGKIGLRAVW